MSTKFSAVSNSGLYKPLTTFCLVFVFYGMLLFVYFFARKMTSILYHWGHFWPGIEREWTDGVIDILNFENLSDLPAWLFDKNFEMSQFIPKWEFCPNFDAVSDIYDD